LRSSRINEQTKDYKIKMSSNKQSASVNWLKSVKNIERLIKAVSLDFQERAKYPKSSASHIKISSKIRSNNVKLNAQITDLSRGLDEFERNNSITSLEKDRRSKTINKLRINLKQFEEQLQTDNLINLGNNEPSTSSNSQSQSSFHQHQPRENEETEEFSSKQLILQQDRALSDQDRGIETLSHIIGNQKNIASAIGREVDRQNDMIEGMDDKMEGIQERLIKETKRIRFIDRKSSTCGLWILVLILLIAIIVIAAIPLGR